MVIADGGAAHRRPQAVDGPRSIGSSLGPPGLKSSFLPGSLVQPGPHVGLPVFAQMHIRDHVVVLNH